LTRRVETGHNLASLPFRRPGTQNAVVGEKEVLFNRKEQSIDVGRYDVKKR
jgi:hypothetical protein